MSEALEFRSESEAGVQALAGPAEGGGQSEFGDGDGMHGRRADVTGPASGEREGMGLRDSGHGAASRGGSTLMGSVTA